MLPSLIAFFATLSTLGIRENCRYDCLKTAVRARGLSYEFLTLARESVKPLSHGHSSLNEILPFQGVNHGVYSAGAC